MNHTKKRVSIFWRPTMMQMKPKATRIAFGPTEDQFQERRVIIWPATSAVSQRACSWGVVGGFGAASQARVRTAWFRALRVTESEHRVVRTCTREHT